MELAADDKRRILFVDDEEVIRSLFTKIFEKDGRYEIQTAYDGEDALEKIAENDYSLVITDLQMPRMAGLPFLRELKKRDPAMPFMVFTGFGGASEVIEALRMGALNFFQKPWDLEQIVPAVEKALEAVEKSTRVHRAYGHIDLIHIEYTVPPMLREKDPLIEHLIDPLVPLGIVGEGDMANVFLALDEVINNAMTYGALKLDSSLRDEEEGQHQFAQLLVERENDPKYQERTIKVTADFSREGVTYNILDPGDGFDRASLPDPTDPANLLREHGRGLLLVGCFMDSLEFNEKGNGVTIARKRAG